MALRLSPEEAQRETRKPQTVSKVTRSMGGGEAPTGIQRIRGPPGVAVRRPVQEGRSVVENVPPFGEVGLALSKQVRQLGARPPPRRNDHVPDHGQPPYFTIGLAQGGQIGQSTVGWRIRSLN